MTTISLRAQRMALRKALFDVLRTRQAYDRALDNDGLTFDQQQDLFNKHAQACGYAREVLKQTKRVPHE